MTKLFKDSQAFKHSKLFTIAFRDVDKHHRLRMSALVDFMQETSNEHAGLVGFDFSDSELEGKYYWIVSRAKMVLDTLPKWKETIRIETYPDGIDKLFAVRRFNIYNSQDEQIGYIIGNYILIAQDTHRPVRIKNLTGKLAELEWNYEGEELLKLKAPITTEQLDQRTVRSGDIDSNEHMNNAHYIRWSTDMFTTKELSAHPVRSIQTNYVTALLEGDTVKIVRGKDDEGNIIVQGMSSDEAKIYWTSKIECAE